MSTRRLWAVVLLAGVPGAAMAGQSVKLKAGAAPPPGISTFSTADLSRTGIFYAGGKYVGAPGKEVMGGSAYVEVWVPK